MRPPDTREYLPDMKSLLAALTCILALAGCASGGVDGNPPSGSNAGDSESDESAEPEGPDPTFGQAYTFDDGLSVTVGKPKKFKPSPYSSLTNVNDWPAYRSFQVVVVNGTKKKFDASMFTVTVQSKDEEGEEVFDSEKGIEGAPQTTLLPGRQSKFKIVWGVKDPNDLVMDVDVDFEHESITYVQTG